jgi:hypothetical protein
VHSIHEDIGELVGRNGTRASPAALDPKGHGKLRVSEGSRLEPKRVPEHSTVVVGSTSWISLVPRFNRRYLFRPLAFLLLF